MSGDSLTTAFQRYWYPLMALVRRDFKKRYATSILGVAWTVLRPLFLVAIYLTVFGFILPGGGGEGGATAFAIYLISGMLPYLAVNEGIQSATTSLQEDAALLERPGFPAEVVPASRAVTASIGEGIGLMLLILLMALIGQPPGPWVLALPLLVLLRLVMTCGIGWGVSMLAVFVTDLTEVLSLMLNAWLFLTPIFYSVDIIPGPMQRLMVVNPLYHLVAAYRNVLVDGVNPFPSVLIVAAWAFALAAFGLWFFRKVLDRGKDFL